MWKIVVKVGQQVGADETLMILESMKMEIPVNGTKAGRVAKIHVKEGQAVREGELLGDLDCIRRRRAAAAGRRRRSRPPTSPACRTRRTSRSRSSGSPTAAALGGRSAGRRDRTSCQPSRADRSPAARRAGHGSATSV